MIATPSSTPLLPTTLQTVEEFEQWQRRHVTEGSYEFVRGRIIPKPAMKREEAFLANYLLRVFMGTEAFRRGDMLLPEMDAYIDQTRKRIPDVTYLTAEQLTAARQGERVRTLFAIEILSDSESYEEVTNKIQDYFDGGAQLVWYVAPKQQKIYVYTSPDESKAYKGLGGISAAPVIPDFQFTVADLFA